MKTNKLIELEEKLNEILKMKCDCGGEDDCRWGDAWQAVLDAKEKVRYLIARSFM